jgi:hypothetical protein
MGLSRPFVSESIGVFGLYLDTDLKAVDFYLNMSFLPLVEIQTDRPTAMYGFVGCPN